MLIQKIKDFEKSFYDYEGTFSIKLTRNLVNKLVIRSNIIKDKSEFKPNLNNLVEDERSF